TLYSVSAKDGLTIAALTNGVAMDPLFGNPGARFDAQKFGWIGSIGKLQNGCATWHESPIRKLGEARGRGGGVAAGGAASNTAIVPRVLNTLLGTRFKIISGYDSGTGLNMALESREVEGICGLSWSTLKASRPDWIREHKLNVILQMALEKLPELGDVPSALDLVADPSARKVLELILIRQEMGRPLAAPPGVPPRGARLSPPRCRTWSSAPRRRASSSRSIRSAARRSQNCSPAPTRPRATSSPAPPRWSSRDSISLPSPRPRVIARRAKPDEAISAASYPQVKRDCFASLAMTDQTISAARGLRGLAGNDRNNGNPMREPAPWQKQWRKRRQRRPGRARRRSARRAATRTSSTR